MAVFASKASRSNCNVIPPERLAHGSRELAAGFLTERRPVVRFGRSAVVDDHTHLLVVPNPRKRLSKPENFLVGDVLGFDRSDRSGQGNSIKHFVIA